MFFLMMGIHRGRLDCSSHVPISASIRLEMSDEGLMPKSWRLANTDTCVDVLTVSILIFSTCIDMPLLARKVLEATGPGWYQSALKNS